MTIIKIAFSVKAETVAKIEALLEEMTLHDVNWSGAEFKIVRSDFTCIENYNSADAVSLLREIQSIISDI